MTRHIIIDTDHRPGIHTIGGTEFVIDSSRHRIPLDRSAVPEYACLCLLVTLPDEVLDAVDTNNPNQLGRIHTRLVDALYAALADKQEISRLKAQMIGWSTRFHEQAVEEELDEWLQAQSSSRMGMELLPETITERRARIERDVAQDMAGEPAHHAFLHQFYPETLPQAATA